MITLIISLLNLYVSRQLVNCFVSPTVISKHNVCLNFETSFCSNAFRYNAYLFIHVCYRCICKYFRIKICLNQMYLLNDLKYVEICVKCPYSLKHLVYTMCWYGLIIPLMCIAMILLIALLVLTVFKKCHSICLMVHKGIIHGMAEMLQP